jgi:putative ABC transport system permease protein
MKQFLRNFNKQKVVGLLNICSLSLGIMVAVIVGLWAINELSFDNFHRNRAQIYRINSHHTLNGVPAKLGGTYKPMGELAKAELPQIADMVRVFEDHLDLKINNELYPGTKIFVADGNFFTFFTFPLKEGEAATALSAPDRVVISEAAATKYFPGQDAMGQMLSIFDFTFTVSGVMQDMPKNSSLQSDFVFPFFGWYLNWTWGYSDGFLTFFSLPEDTDVKQMEESLTQILVKTLSPYGKVFTTYSLEPLSEIHFSSGFQNDESVVKGNKSLVMVFVLIALIILIISCINFTNLFVSTSFLRAKTIGVKKSQGAQRKELIAGFYVETACYVLLSIAAGIFLAYLALPVFNNFTHSNIAIDLMSAQLYLFLAALFVVTVLLAGTFPAFYMTRFNPIETLFGKFKGNNISVFQKSLIIVQFSASIALLIVVGFMQKQVDFMVNHDLGFDRENVIYVQGRGQFSRNYDALRDDLLKYPAITDVTLKNSLPTQWRQGWWIGTPGSTDVTLMEVNQVEPNYFEFMDMRLIEGENPFYLQSNDSITPVIINESALKLLNLESSPVNQIIRANSNQNIIIKGILRNANVRSLRDDVDPQIYMKVAEHTNKPVFFKVTGNPQQAISVIHAKWEELEPDYPFEYHFLDDTYKALYAPEMSSEKVLAFAMLITFIISIAGLFAMAFYATQRRIKEIGLRKVNGATLKDLLLLLNKDFVIWVLISFLIASPVAYFCLQSWLDGFTVKTSLSIWLFLLVGIIALAVALLTTSFQTWKVATMNPVKTLKAE